MFRFWDEPLTLDKLGRIGLGLVGITLLVSLVVAIWEVLLPFLLAGLFAYVMMPIVRFLQHKMHVRSRGLSVLIVFVLITLLFTAGFLYLVPEIEREVQKTLQALEIYNGKHGILEMILPESVLQYIREAVNLEAIGENLTPDKLGQMFSAFQEQAGGVISGTLSVFSWGMVFAMGLVYFIFIMIDFEGLGNGFIGLFPECSRSTIRSVFRELDYFMNAYFRGQALIAISVGVLVAVGFNIIGLPMATALGIFIGLLNFIPYMQAFGIPPMLLASVLMAAQTGENVLVCISLSILVLFVVQIIQETILVPRIMGATMGMRPSLILLSLAVWGVLLGFFGLLIALPVSMALYSLYMRYVLKDDAYIRLMDEKLKKREQKLEKVQNTEKA